MASKETISQKARRALKQAIKDLVKERRLNNDKVVIWKNGHVVRISAKRV